MSFDSNLQRWDLRVLLVDPSLFTAPYDAALDQGLAANGVSTIWSTRELRAHEPEELIAPRVVPPFYSGVEGKYKRTSLFWRIRKVISHFFSWERLLKQINTLEIDVLHVQWCVMPLIDLWMMKRALRKVPVVLTIHDTKPFNGTPTSFLQTIAFDKVLRIPTKVIVHTAEAKRKVVEIGVGADNIAVIPHGPLYTAASDIRKKIPGQRWKIVLVGRIQHYKGVDILVEAVGSLTQKERANIKVLIAGEPKISLDSIEARIAALGLDSDVLEIIPGYLTENKLQEILTDADAFVFPYRDIEASGVLFLVGHLGKWIVASDLGSFREVITEGVNGNLVAPNDVKALAEALKACAGKQVTVPVELVSWGDIGIMTKRVYQSTKLLFNK